MAAAASEKPVDVEAEVIPPAGGSPMSFPGARTALGAAAISRAGAWFAWGMITGAVLVGLFVWKTREKRSS